MPTLIISCSGSVSTIFPNSKHICKNMKSGVPEEKVKEVFAGLDKNNDGTISEEELSAPFKAIGISDTEEKKVKEIFKEVDTDNNGTLDLAARSFSYFYFL